MAIRNTAEVVGGLKSTDEIPYNTRVRLRCLDEELKNSKNSGNIMIERTWEIVHPEQIELKDGRKVEVIGIELTQYKVVRNYMEDKETINEKKSAASIDAFLSERRALGLPVEATIDDEAPPMDLKGKIVEATISSQARPQTEPLTAEDRAKGKTQGAAIKVNGKPLITYQPQVVALLEMSSMQVGQQY